jgi:hypothetical protein
VTSPTEEGPAVPSSDSVDLLLPPGTCLVHIGPPKTGTTAIQGAFHDLRPETSAQGVHYAGRPRHSGKAIQAVTERAGFFTDGKPVDISAWHKLVKDSQQPADMRVLVSSEFFADALEEQIPRIVDDLGRERVHVVVTLRPLGKIVTSQWQQYVQSGMRVSFVAWLEAQFGEEQPPKVTPTFWRRHRHDLLVRRWINVVGAENLTVVAVDDRDHGMLLRTFEGLTGLREGTLVSPPDVTNRSMSLPEIEAVRALNILFTEEGLPYSAQSRLIHFGAAPYMKLVDPPADEAKVEMPRWAAERVHQLSLEMVEDIKSTGVRIIGDIDRMALPVLDAPEEIPETVDVPATVSARLAMGVLQASGAARRAREGARAQPAAEPPEVARISTAQLGRILAYRVRAVGYRRVKSATGKVSGKSSKNGKNGGSAPATGA